MGKATIQESTTEEVLAHAWLANSGLGFIANNNGVTTSRFTAARELLWIARQNAGRWVSRVPFKHAVMFELAHSTRHDFMKGTYTIIRPYLVED